MNFGKGHVVVLGEAAMLSAQLAGPNGNPFGMNRPGIDNRQLALNIMHWLSGLQVISAFAFLTLVDHRPTILSTIPDN